MITQSAIAQNTCCAGAGANYTVLPNLNKNIIGARYSFSRYSSENHVVHNGRHESHTEAIPVKERLQTLEIFGRFNLTSRLQLSVFVPVNFISQRTTLIRKTNGLGDMSFLLQYSFLNPVFCGNPKPRHQLRGGLGVKLPSGAFGERGATVFSTNLQPGTGSIDFLGSLIYTFRHRQFGFNTGTSYKLNTVNPAGYYFGDKALANIQLFYVFEVKKLLLMPSAGFTYEHQRNNRYKKEIITDTDGHSLGASAGFDVYYKQFAFTAAIIPAFLNHLNGGGQTRGKLAFEAGVFYNFSITKPQGN